MLAFSRFAALLLFALTACTQPTAQPTAESPTATPQPRPAAASTTPPPSKPAARPQPTPGLPAAARDATLAALPTRGPCGFELGFATLVRALGPEIVGQCSESERTNPANGDREQKTTRGMLLWRQTTGDTSFTAGATAWYACPNGVERRASDEAFRCATAAAIAPGPNTPTPLPAASAPQACQQALPWSEARSHLGQRVIVYGPVVQATFASSSGGQPTFLDLGVAYPDPNRLTVFIPSQVRAAFSSPPEQLFAGKTICVSGTLSLFQGIAQIEITAPDNIVVI